MQSNIVNPSAKYKTEAVVALKNKVEEKLKARFGEAIISTAIDYDFPVFMVKRDAVIEVLEHLYHENDLSFQFLTTLAASHKPENKGKSTTRSPSWTVARPSCGNRFSATFISPSTLIRVSTSS